MILAVDDQKFNSLFKIVSASKIADKQTIAGTVFIENKEYVVTGCLFGNDGSYSEFFAQEVVNIGNYVEKEKKNKEDLYEGMVVKFGKRNLVMTNEITIISSKCGTQTNLFS